MTTYYTTTKKSLPSKLSLAEYQKLEYPIEIVHDEQDAAWIASVPDLPGCNSYGDSVSAAVDNVTKMKDLWLEGQFNSNQYIPVPTEEDGFSGKFVLRIPKSLHRSLAYQARKQGVSLNQYASHLLSERNSINHFHEIARGLFELCNHQPQDHWRNSGTRTMFVKAEVPGRLEFVGFIRKPDNEVNFRIPKKKFLENYLEPGK
jgi:antitoxin HicB